MKTLIATDGSEYSRAAIDECCRIFEKMPGAEIKIISVYEPAIPAADPFGGSAEYIRQMDEDSRAQADKAVEQALEQVREKCPALAVKTTFTVVSGAPARLIVEEAENWGADLIISGSHGYGFWKRAWLGSVSNAIVHNAPCTVLIVRAKKAAQSAAAQ